MVSDPSLIRYACIAHGSTILAEFNSADSSIQILAHQCIQQTPPHHSMFSHTLGDQTYTFLIDDPFVFFAIFHRSLEKTGRIRFLNRLKDAFLDLISKNKSCDGADGIFSSHCFQGELHPIFHQLMSKRADFGDALKSSEANGLNDDSSQHLVSGLSNGRTILSVPLHTEAGEGLEKSKERLLGESRESKEVLGEDKVDFPEDGNIPSRELIFQKGGGLCSVDRGGRQWAKKIWRRHVWMFLKRCLSLGRIWKSTMGEPKMEEMTLPSLFEQARKIHQVASESTVDQEVIKKGCKALQKCEDMISKLGLFSSNENKDDISTTNLKYLLVPYYLGELTEKLAQDDRIQILKASQAKLKEFISFCDTMELLPQEELELSGQGGSNSFADRRARKIARFKRQKAAESKLLEIKEHKERRGRSTKAAALSTPVEVGEEDVLDEDGEEEREAWLAMISLALCKAFDLLEMLKKEEEMLSAVKKELFQDGNKEFSQSILDEHMKKAEGRHRDAAARAKYVQPAEPITCATFAQDVLEGRANVSQAHEHKHQPLLFGPASLIGGNLTTERERMAAQVFQPSHRLPTMSIEEAGLTEMEMMNKWQERNRKLMEEANSSWYKDNQKLSPANEDSDDDNAVEKARAWDDWKDDNPRGAGNKKLTPCG
ncbi:hypothetical protein Nepgr_010727 [Nepenthes gracilis]|uniref:PP2A regulatory subunit TAP46 n=1 Tax=Nepenthes gracilis TaxID=150966 RepID=A0AAD3SD65_NEPGR|nr:hypothetical protein Nepgr_010727 [Nepenthes gracilis]